eukprot:SAG11_NODE_5021_length_1688_cov_21.617999_1_plen_206_part_10
MPSDSVEWELLATDGSLVFSGGAGDAYSTCPGGPCVGSWSECDANCERTYSIAEPGTIGHPQCPFEDGAIDTTHNTCHAGLGECTYLSGSCDTESFDYEEGTIIYEATENFLCWAHYDVGEDPSACPDYEAATIEGGAMRLLPGSDVVTNWPAYDAGQVYMSWTINVSSVAPPSGDLCASDTLALEWGDAFHGTSHAVFGPNEHQE